MSRHWSDEVQGQFREIVERLEENWRAICAEINAITGESLTPKAVRDRAIRLGLRKTKPDTEDVWTEERVTSLKEAWAKGVSAGQIAKDFACGISRNAILGKIYRLGLTRDAGISEEAALARRAARVAIAREKKALDRIERGAPKHVRRVASGERAITVEVPPAPSSTPRPSSPPSPHAIPFPAPFRSAWAVPDFEPSETPETGVLLRDLKEGHCRYPIDQMGGQHVFCGGGRVPGSSYCARHRRMAYRPTPRY